MNFLKGLALSLLSFLLLLSLSIFGLALTLNQTILNPDFTISEVDRLDIPAWLQTWFPQFLDNFLAPLEIFSIGLLVAGIALIIVSFVYKPRQASF